MANNQLKIIAGEWRGRPVHFDDAKDLRPTSARIRETLFNWIANRLPESNCLDLFSGSGVLGLEALSRGAKHCSFVDTNRQSLNNTKKTLEKFSENQDAKKNAAFINQNALRFIQSADIKQFDIIFIDPPYSQFDLSDFSQALEENFETNKPYTIFYEHSQALNLDDLPKNWSIKRQKKAGKVNFYLLLRN